MSRCGSSRSRPEWCARRSSRCNRLGSAEAADSVYRGVREPLVAEDIADCIGWAVTRPHHVNIDLMVVRPLAQAAQHKVHREG